MGYPQGMDKTPTTPATLVDAVRYFTDPDVCLSFMVAIRWPDGNVTCPHCGSREVAFLSNYRRWLCRAGHARPQFSIKVGTIFEDSPIPLDKWLPAVWMIVNDKNGISSYELARALGVTQKTGWFMLHRIRLAMQRNSFGKMSGHVEADETFIGGKARFMHAGKRREKIKGRGPLGKAVVMGLLSRHGEDGHSTVRVSVVGSQRRSHIQAEVRKHVAPGATLYTDELRSYSGLNSEYAHKVIKHAEAYVDGNIHTNGMENFWSLLKRAIKGTYVSVEPFHLFRYLDEQAFRFNERGDNDGGRFLRALRTIVGRRLTYKELIGDAGLATTPA
jgi:transposase-like protein